MFTYCGNNPVCHADYSGEFGQEIIEYANEVSREFQNLVYQYAPAFATLGVSTIVDGPLPVADAIAGSACATLTIVLLGQSIITTFAPSPPIAKTEEKKETVAVQKRSYKPIVFPADPNLFVPFGLNKIYRPGTKNGAIISWVKPYTNEEVFRWDENPNFPNGSHYHIEGNGHYYSGETVPEPYATIYFPFRLF